MLWLKFDVSFLPFNSIFNLHTNECLQLQIKTLQTDFEVNRLTRPPAFYSNKRKSCEGYQICKLFMNLTQ